MKPMIFSNDTAREQLLDEGIVATFRTTFKQEGGLDQKNQDWREDS